MTGVTLSRLDELLEREQVRGLGGDDERAQGLAQESEHQVAADDATAAGEPSLVEPPAVRHERPGRGERAPQVGERMVRDVVEDEVVALPASREVVLGVVDDVIGTYGSDHLHVAGAAHAGHLGTERPGNLHGEGADAPGSAVDQDLLPGADAAQGLEGDLSGHRYGRRLLEREVDRLQCKLILRSGRVLGIRANRRPEDLVAGLEARYAAADGLDNPRHVRAANADLRLAQSVYRAGDVREATHDRPVGDVDAGSPYANQDPPIADVGPRDVPWSHNID